MTLCVCFLFLSNRYYNYTALLSFLIEEDSALERSHAEAGRRGQPLVAASESAAKRSVVVRDPDGLLIEFYCPRSASLSLPDPRKASAEAHWCLAA